MLNKALIAFIVLLNFQTATAAPTLTLYSDSLEKTTFKHKFKLFPKAHRIGWKNAVTAPLILGSAGLILHQSVPRNPLGRHSIRDEVQYRFAKPETNLDDHLRGLPTKLVFGMNLLGHRGKNNVGDVGLIYLKSKLILDFSVSQLKNATKIERPDGSNYSSFPSHHTASAFMSATILHREYGHLSPWYSIAGYSAAATVGWLRIQKNVHWASDVLTGAGIGILIPNLVYLTHRYTLIPRLKRWIAIPTYSNKMMGMSVILKI
jgi:membrane-associated phospholipid phosphatase